MVKKYCTGCGRKLKQETEMTEFYDPYTGEQEVLRYTACPRAMQLVNQGRGVWDLSEVRDGLVSYYDPDPSREADKNPPEFHDEVNKLKQDG